MTLWGHGPVFWIEELAYAELEEDYGIRTSTTPVGDKNVRMEISVWEQKSGRIVNRTVVEGRAEAINEEHFCPPPEDIPLSSVDKALCDAVREAKKWLERNLLPPRVRVKATSANIMEKPSLQSARVVTVDQESILRKVGEQDGWIKVIVEDGKIGWIYGELVK